MRVVKVIDCWGWAYDFVGREQRRYSRHEIVIQRYDDVKLDGVDLLYIHGPDIHADIDSVVSKGVSRGIPVIGGYGGYSETRYSHVDAICCIAPQSYQWAKRHYDCPIYFVTEGIDDNYWNPTNNRPCSGELLVGWAGRPEPVKRPHLLEALARPVVMQSEHDGYSDRRDSPLYMPDRSLEPMREFYRSIDVLVLVSRSECMPRVILEAMASGLPVVTTDVGNVRSIVDPKWIVPVEPEADVVREMNIRLDCLASPRLCAEVGKRNRETIERVASWEVVQPEWDRMFDLVASAYCTS